MLELTAKNREILGKKVKVLREKGIIPVVLYGEKIKPVSLEMDYHEFEKIYEQAGESTIIKLKIGESSKNVLIYDVGRDPVSDKYIHVDFYAVRMDKLITTEVPLVFEGESPVVETEDGVLIKSITEVEVEALPVDLPHEIKVDISVLKTFDDSINIKDLKVLEGVRILVEPDEVVVSVIPPRSEEELAELEEKPEEAEEAEKVEEEKEGEEPVEEKPVEEKEEEKKE